MAVNFLAMANSIRVFVYMQRSLQTFDRMAHIRNPPASNLSVDGMLGPTPELLRAREIDDKLESAPRTF